MPSSAPTTAPSSAPAAVQKVDVRALREALHMTQEQMARELDCSQATISRLERYSDEPAPELQERLERLEKAWALAHGTAVILCLYLYNQEQMG
jgi:transcriptional regulator with XRE-family HTH domain